MICSIMFSSLLSKAILAIFCVCFYTTNANMVMMTKEDAAELEELRASAAGKDANNFLFVP